MDSSSAAMITCGVAAVVCHWVSVRRFIWRNRPQRRPFQAGMAENELLHNRQGLSLVHGPRGFVYIDNIRLIGKDRWEVNLLMEKICRELCSRTAF